MYPERYPSSQRHQNISNPPHNQTVLVHQAIQACLNTLIRPLGSADLAGPMGPDDQDDPDDPDDRADLTRKLGNQEPRLVLETYGIPEMPWESRYRATI